LSEGKAGCTFIREFLNVFDQQLLQCILIPHRQFS
jgi:hypothetical protein